MNAIAATADPPRNAGCPCGSGRRYKDCHGALGARPLVAGSADDLLREAQFALATGRAADAQRHLAQALAQAPERGDLLLMRARVELSQGDAGAVAASCRAVLALAPDAVPALNLLGEALYPTDAAAAEAAWRQALSVEPGNAEAEFHLGNLERERGSPAAVEHYRLALARAPGHPGVLNNLGLAYEAQGLIEPAEACYREVLTSSPEHVDALANLAILQTGRADHATAAETFERALAVRRDFPARFWTRRATALHAIGAYARAEQSFREVSRLEPDNVDAALHIGSIAMLQSKFDDAEAAFERALELDRDNPYALTMRVYVRMQHCLWDGLAGRFEELQRALEHGAPRAIWNAAPFPLLAMPLPPSVLLRAAEAYAGQLARLAAPLPALVPAPTPAGRLRVGFASSDFRAHATSLLLVECIERLDRSRIETFAYGLLPDDSSPIGRRIRDAFEHFADLSSQTPQAIAQRIRDDRIAVLVDLNGYTTHARSEVFVHRAAPVQVSWLGYLGTLGASWYDHVITDRFATPEDQQAFFTERFLYMPHCYCPGDRKREIAREAPARAACGLPPEGFVFCCFNTPFKILPPVFDVWMRLLERVPGSVLWLSPGYPAACDNLRREAAARGIDPQRLVIAPRVLLGEHLARHAHADLFLDTAPYNAGTTANDALFMGVPVLTCSGHTMASRVAGSQLRAIGLPELAVGDLAAYEALALRLAGDPAALAAVRARLAANRDSCALFDMAGFASALGERLLLAAGASSRAERQDEHHRRER
ncbi:MAG: tetratricopeptide repeat protein [Casimicrobiaceae bacterium]